MAALTPAQLVAKLEAGGVPFSQHQHAAVMTVEAQEAALAGQPGVVLKNLFLKDKKNRYYVVTALPSTTVDLNILSARLGTGKGGVRFAPEEALSEVLQVPAGSVTPLVVANPSTKDVVLFLDTHVQQADRVFVHPLVNTSSLGLTPTSLVDALKVLGREALFVDLQADPKIDRENPPDLAKYVVAPPPKPDPAAAPTAPAPAAPGPSSTAATSSAPGQAGTASGATKKDGKAGKGGAGKGAASSQASNHVTLQALTDVQGTTQKLMDMLSEALVGKKVADAGLDAYTAQRLRADLEAQLNAFKNAAYTLGHVAGKEEVVAFAQRRFA